MSPRKVLWLFMQGCTIKYYLCEAECGDFVVNRQARPCIQGRHNEYLCDTIIINRPRKSRCKDMGAIRNGRFSKRRLYRKMGLQRKEKIMQQACFSLLAVRLEWGDMTNRLEKFV
ncbi:hypothetical protein [Bacteroides hominis]|uniref:hypothetical protein n=1 Tax=Bacteroides hominis TaxID=2763023 RepID=UPI00164C5090|nr:hypothetical protein [Bacteroides hominis (ex Liu et al. 2022)]MBC5614626.1 hypothetical protein [Bacteroides hominis (ex Liu et al. 2022)]